MTHAHAHHHSEGAMPQHAVYAALIVSAVLIAAKGYAWWATGSLSIFSSVVDSLMDLSISAINLLAIRYSQKPADDDHRFGHTSIEDIVGLLQAAFISGSAIFIMIEAYHRFQTPEVLKHSLAGSWVMVFSLVLTTGLVLYQRQVLRKTGSVVVAADALHYVSDLLMNASIIASLILAYYFSVPWLDAALATLIALYMLWGAREIGHSSFNNLMDKELDEEQRLRIHEIVASYPEIKGMHGVKTRVSGSKVFIQCDIELDGEMKLFEAHEITDELERELKEAFTAAEVIIHQDPVGFHPHD